jgi:hypothetical protein
MEGRVRMIVEYIRYEVPGARGQELERAWFFERVEEIRHYGLTAIGSDR